MAVRYPSTLSWPAQRSPIGPKNQGLQKSRRYVTEWSAFDTDRANPIYALYERLRISSMTGSTRSSEGLAPRQRRLLFQAWHRGMREMDLVMGRFVDAEIDRFSEADLLELERLIDVPDPELFAWVAGDLPVPADYDGPLFRRMCAFQGRRHPDI